tara:strand:+ start:1130 stop:1987 length:858 start_codon:yes stop_codon:yes gene_type:complete
MGWNPFKNLKKIVKGIGKGIKKIGKGIKKVMGKIMKPFAKLGIVGQIALGFIMPWAAGAIFSGFGTMAAGMAASSNAFISAAGGVMQSIHAGAISVKGAFTRVTDAISGGLETVTGKAKEMFGIQADASDFVKNSPNFKPEMSVVETKDMGQFFRDKAAGITTETVKEKTFTEGLVEKAKEAVLDAPGKLIEGTITSAAAGIKTGIARAISPEGDIIYPPEVVDMLGSTSNYSSVFNETDLVAEDAKLHSQGGMYGGLVHGATVQADSSFGLQDSVWVNYMQGAR